MTDNRKPEIKAIVTGATGMVGEGVLHECLLDDRVTEVLVLTRKPSGVAHAKVKELVVPDLFDLSKVTQQLTGYNACFFCAGVTSLGKKEDEYYRLTYTLTMNVAEPLSKLNPDMVFCYVSGAHTDSTEHKKTMWARVKGKTENDLAKLPFKREYNFRPGFMRATPGLKNVLGMYKYIGWLYPVLRALFPNTASTLAEVGQAMINAADMGYPRNILEVKDIVALAKGEVSSRTD